VTRPGQGGEVVGQGSQDKALSDFKLTEKVIGQLKSLVAKVVADGAVREDQLRAVRHYLQRYYHLKGTGYAVAINNALSREFQQLGAGELDAKDIEAIWAGEKSGNT
jgi:hypothetical protein